MTLSSLILQEVSSARTMSRAKDIVCVLFLRKPVETKLSISASKALSAASNEAILTLSLLLIRLPSKSIVVSSVAPMNPLQEGAPQKHFCASFPYL